MAMSAICPNVLKPGLFDAREHIVMLGDTRFSDQSASQCSPGRSRLLINSTLLDNLQLLRRYARHASMMPRILQAATDSRAPKVPLDA